MKGKASSAQNTLRAIIFDFNGVIVDDEPLHFLGFREALTQEGIRLTRKEYYERYLALDDRSLVREVLARSPKEASRQRIARIRRSKETIYRRLLQNRCRIFPGARRFVETCAGRYPLAIASGALRSEIQWILRKSNMTDFFCAIVSADEVAKGKPHPETFTQALRKLNRGCPGDQPRIRPEECLVIEDSLHGVASAHRAGMRCLAVAHSYPLSRFGDADWRARKIGDLRLSKIESEFSRPRSQTSNAGN
ncbi:MAG: HAD family phosphatase [Acidobacteriia bacterium]|nr:HAD family phosphatase [Terriglobia bacterium]